MILNNNNVMILKKRIHLSPLFLFILLLQFSLKTTGQEVEYPFWGKYVKTPNGEAKPDLWKSRDHIKEGWDWSLPPHTKVSPKGLIGMARVLNSKSLHSLSELPKVNFECNPIVDIWFHWNTIEAVEGVYDFSQIKNAIDVAAKRGYGSCIRLMTSRTASAPDWLKSKYQVPSIRSQKKGIEREENYDLANPLFHDKYRALIAAFGKSGIPAMKEVKGLYVGYASPSLGDEGIGPHGVDPDSVQHVRERLDAWEAITKGFEYKVYMGGNCNYGFSKGFGVRRGFVEMYLYQIPSPEIGQTLDENGYLVLNESCPLIAKEALHGEVNEEYDEKWATVATQNRYGNSTDSFPYRYFTSSLRMLQMRVNLACYPNFTLIPAMIPWMSLEVGRTAKTAPDAWCFLRESYLKGNAGAVKNFERWVFQRDSPGYETTAVVKINQANKMHWVEPGKYYDYIARTGDKIGFNVDTSFLKSKKQKVAIKISYLDEGKGEWLLSFNGAKGTESRSVKCLDSKKILTTTFFVEADFNQKNNSSYDFECLAQKGLKPIVSFVRIVKL